ncbi:prephenate dehydratase [Desulfallas thermosapovorans]|uniref:Bifunctional chorismate mutase/prephenate dehydratase n=1 Tax=Desulfallas thermosapovorans DSM 6562 TaxID=1121431 RepID=A0A5S4ZTF0_9FIRM|nr:prephenate dehydratase [Desulfallas thermosapovorans]TYO96232.1 prephenate dehydratase [Desulfallas thermosapovorans DSM 6562]
MRTLGYLGPPGTFSHTAALNYSDIHGYTPVCCVNLRSIVQKVASGALACGIVPVENSLGGSVGETLDLLTVAEGIYVTAELKLPVKQHLLARPGVALADIEKVYSHPQALAQCRSFLEQRLPGRPVVEATSTAAAALKVTEANDVALAAVGSSSAAFTYGLQILHADIQDKADNATRFFVLGREEPIFTGPAKTSLILALRDCPGALYRILRPLAQLDINLTRIESRPSGGKLGDYIFFIDFIGRTDCPKVRYAIKELQKNTLWLKLLGCYPDVTGGIRHRSGGKARLTGLPGLRAEIDSVDTAILQLLAKRKKLVEQVAAFKNNINCRK